MGKKSKRKKRKSKPKRRVKRKMVKKVKVDKTKCIGCGTCTVVAGKSFKLGDDGKAQPIEPPGDSEAEIKEAIESCPVEAISWKNSN